VGYRLASSAFLFPGMGDSQDNTALNLVNQSVRIG
jgi:hypothetical protein